MNLRNSIAGLTLAVAALTPSRVTAEPETVSLSGTVTDGAGGWSGDVGTNFEATITFDLDEAHAYAKELLAPAGEEPYTRWTFHDEPYHAVITGAFGTLSATTVILETVNDFDADAAGNPFGLTGVVDALTIEVSTVVVDCANGEIDPVTGCSDPNAPLEFGQEFLINFVAASDWLDDGATLPATIPPPGGLVTIFGQGEEIVDGDIASEIVVEFELDEGLPFHRGDADGTGVVELTDGVYILSWLFLTGSPPPCMDAADADDNEVIELTDAVYVLSFLFLGGPAPTEPGPPATPCGLDPDRGATLGCDSYAGC